MNRPLRRDDVGAPRIGLAVGIRDDDHAQRAVGPQSEGLAGVDGLGPGHGAEYEQQAMIRANQRHGDLQNILVMAGAVAAAALGLNSLIKNCRPGISTNR